MADVKDYTATLATAKRLVRKFGREIALVKYDTVPADNAKPWDGPTDPRAVASISLFAVVVPPSSQNELGELLSGDLLKVSTLLYIAEVGEDDPDNIGDYNEVIDGTKRYAIQATDKLAPGDTTLLYFIGVKQ